MTETEKYLLALTRMTQLEDVWAAHRGKMEEYGFDLLLYAATRFRTDNGAGDLRDALILTNYPRDFTDGYLEGGLFRNAPVVRWAMNNTGARSWSDIECDAREGRLTQAEMAVCAYNKRHGIKAGYAISFPCISARACHGIGLSSTRMSQAEIDALWQEKGEEIALFNHIAHLTICTLPYGDYGRPLTPRQREVLELVAEGKTVQDAATVLARNPATVEKHLRLAREALDVETTAQAIMKAGLQNQFFRIEA